MARGPDRNDISREAGLLKDWPTDGPKLLWTYEEAGKGYSGPAIVGDKYLALGADNTSDFVLYLERGRQRQKGFTNHDRARASTTHPSMAR